MDPGLGVGLALGLLVGAGLALAAGRALGGYPEPARRGRVLGRGELAFLAATADAVFPAGGPVAPSGTQAGVPAYLDDYLARLPPRPRRLVRALLFLVEHATLVFPAPGRGGFRRFSALAPEQRAVVLEGWAESRLFPRRLAFTSLRALLTMGYFADPAVLRALGLAPLAIDTPVVEADLLYARVGRSPDSIGPTVDGRGPPRPRPPLEPGGPIHPAYRARGAPRAPAEREGAS